MSIVHTSASHDAIGRPTPAVCAHQSIIESLSLRLEETVLSLLPSQQAKVRGIHAGVCQDLPTVGISKDRASMMSLQCDEIYEALREPLLSSGEFGRPFIAIYPVNGRFLLEDVCHRLGRGPRLLRTFLEEASETTDANAAARLIREYPLNTVMAAGGLSREFYLDWLQESAAPANDPVYQLRAKLEGLGVSVHYEQSKILEYLSADDQKLLVSILRELCFNAIQASNNCRENVVVTLGQKGATLFASVKDSGCGIEPERLPKIFHRKRGRGSCRGGRGLPWVKETVEQGLGGSIALPVSAPGRGTVFQIEIPLQQNELSRAAILDCCQAGHLPR